MQKNRLFLVLISFSILACVSFGVVQIQDVDKPIKLIRYSILQAFPGGKASEGHKGRLFISKVFSVKRGRLVQEHGRYQYVAEVWIRGPRKPYTLDIEAFRVVRSKKAKYQRMDTDQRIAKVMSKAIHKELSKRRKDLNIIDDFRAF